MGVRGVPGGISWDVKIEGQDDGTSGAGGNGKASRDLADRDAGEEGDSKRPRLAGPPGVGGSMGMGEMSLAGAMALAAGAGSAGGSAGVSTPGRSRDGSLGLPGGGSMSPAPGGSGPGGMGMGMTPSVRGRPPNNHNNNTNARSTPSVPHPHHQAPPVPAPVIPMKPLGPPIPLPSGSVVVAKTLPDLYGSVDALNRWCEVEALPPQSGESALQVSREREEMYLLLTSRWQP